MDQIRETLSPLIRAAGVTATARKLGISDAAIHRWMRGKTLSDQTVQRLARIFNYRVEWPPPVIRKR